MKKVDAMLIVQDYLWTFVDSLWKVGQSSLCFLHPVFTDKAFSIDDFSFAVFWSDHCSPKWIANLHSRFMDPDILTFRGKIM